MSTKAFEVKPYPEMWAELDMDVPRFDKARQMLGEVYTKMFLSQQNRPAAMAYFDGVIHGSHGARVREIREKQAAGAKFVGTFCVYVPEELVLAAGGVQIGLCAGAEIAFDKVEEYLPRNTCALIKSFQSDWSKPAEASSAALCALAATSRRSNFSRRSSANARFFCCRRESADNSAANSMPPEACSRTSSASGWP